MKFTHDTILTFLLCSYATGWVMNAIHANKKGRLDLCQFVRWFLFAPFLFMFATILSALMVMVIVPNFLVILEVASILVGGLFIFGAIGYFVVTPAVKKAYGVAKPFSDKVCVVLYRRKW